MSRLPFLNSSWLCGAVHIFSSDHGVMFAELALGMGEDSFKTLEGTTSDQDPCVAGSWTSLWLNGVNR